MRAAWLGQRRGHTDALRRIAHNLLVSRSSIVVENHCRYNHRLFLRWLKLISLVKAAPKVNCAPEGTVKYEGTALRPPTIEMS